MFRAQKTYDRKTQEQQFKSREFRKNSELLAVQSKFQAVATLFGQKRQEKKGALANTKPCMTLIEKPEQTVQWD